MLKRYLKYFLYFIIVAALIVITIIIFNDRQYVLVSTYTALAVCAVFFISYEKKQHSANKTVLLAVMIALSVSGRTAFYLLPNFKPVTALVIITAIYLGAQSGFICGALTALVSNLIFGQGPWTPFQMMAWGLIGVLAALLAKVLLKSLPLLLVFSVFCAIFYSLIMDFWTTISIDGYFNLSRYLILIITATPTTIVHAISNVIFLSLLAKPIGKKLDRIKTKYGF